LENKYVECIYVDTYWLASGRDASGIHFTIIAIEVPHGTSYTLALTSWGEV